MTIKRIINGETVEIELTPAEIRDAFSVYERDCHIEDLTSRYVIDDSKINEIVTIFDNYLSKCDAYYEAYWSMMDYLASEYGLEERNDI